MLIYTNIIVWFAYGDGKIEGPIFIRHQKMLNVFAFYAVKCREREKERKEPSGKQQIIKFQLCEIIFLNTETAQLQWQW